jgi:DNA-binding SARP family transcriptional activator
MDFDILGEVRARRDGDEVELGTAKQRAVLAVLLLEANQPVPAGRIVAAVWGAEPPANGANVVQKYVAGLRRALEPERSPRTPSRVLALHPAGYRLAVEPGSLDADVVAGQVRQAEAALSAGELDRAATLLGDALARWRGEPLAGLHGPVFEAARQRLTERRAAAAELHAEVLLRAGRYPTLLPELVQLLEEFPYRERLHALHLEALYRTGRQAEALAAYTSARRRLVDEVGVEPGPDLRQVHERILRAEPAAGTAPIPVAPRPPPVPPAPVQAVRAAGGRTWTWWATRIAVCLVPLCTIGLLTCAVFAFLAAWRRQRTLGYAAAGYLALAILALIANPADIDHASAARAAAFLVPAMAACLGGTAHTVLVVFRPRLANHAISSA